MKALMTATRVDYCELNPGIGAGLAKSDSSRVTVRNALIEHGFDVELRAVTVGEDLSKYDIVVLDANDPRGPKTQHYFGWMWAMVSELHGGPPTVMNWDHWDIKRIWRGIVNEDPLTPSGPRALSYDVIRNYQKQWNEVQERLLNGQWPPSMVCAFPWGNWGKIFERTNVVPSLFFDPSLDQPVSWEPPSFANKERRWICAALTNHSKWVEDQKLKWPVRYVGCNGMPKMDRDDLLNLYSDSWGVLSPKYYHVGSGYWRARIVHAVARRCLLWSDPYEVMMPNNGWPRSDIIHYARLTDEDLAWITDKQHSSFIKNAEPRDTCIARLGSFMLRQSQGMRQPSRELELAGQTTLT